MSDNTQKINDIEEVLDSGVTNVTVDGITTTFSQEHLYRRRSELQQQSCDLNDRLRKPRVASLLMNRPIR